MSIIPLKVTDTDITPVACPHCGYTSTHVAGISRAGTGPKPGSLNVCYQCLELGVFTDDMTIRPLTPEEHEVAKDSPLLAVMKDSIRQSKQHSARNEQAVKNTARRLN